MIKQTKQGRYRSDSHFIIEISFILPNKQKKMIISLFISDNITVKELREFISKDFNIPINNLNLFNSSKGFLKDSFEFQFKQDNIINLDLILGAPKESAFDLKYKNVSKKEENQKNINEYNLNKKNELKSSVTRINDFFQINSQKREIVNSGNDKKENNLLYNQNSFNNSINNFINEKNINKDEEKKDEIKRNFLNFFLTKNSEKDKEKNINLLNKKRFLSSQKSIKPQNQKNFLKIEQKNNKNVKIINFNINKSLGGVKTIKSN